MNRHRLMFLSVILIATMVRVFLLLYRADDLDSDPDGYVAHAQMVSRGLGFANPYTEQPTAFRPPGLSYVMAWTPGFRATPGKAVAALQLTMGVVTVLLTRQLAEQLRFGEPLSNMAALLVAIDPLLVRYTVLPMTEVLSGTLVVAVCVSNLRLSEALQRMGESKDWLPACFLAAALTGASSLVRPIFLLCGGLLLLGQMWTTWVVSGKSTGEAAALRTRLRKVALVAAVFGGSLVLPLAPWIVRNAMVFRAFIPATTHGGYTLALGNNPSYYRDVTLKDPDRPWNGAALEEWQKSVIGKASEAGVSQADEVAFDRFMYRQAETAIKADPQTFLKACWHRQQYFWAVTAAIPGRGMMRTISQGTAVWYSLLWLGVILSAVLCRRARFAGRHLLWMMVCGFLLMHTFYWTDTRMRAPIMPILSTLAMIGFISLSPSFFLRKESEA